MSAATPGFVVVGIGADGWDGLSPRVRAELRSAAVILGSQRQLDLLPALPATTIDWRSPMSAHLDAVLTGAPGAVPASPRVHLLASGDPMFHGLGATVVRAVGAERVEVFPAVSSASLACAHLGWDLAEVAVVSAVTADPEIILTEVTDGRRVLVLSRDASTPARVAELLAAHGFGDSTFTVLAQLGGPRQQVTASRVGSWDPGARVDPLNVIAVDCIGPRRSALPGRGEDGFDHDGQITKSTIRALTVCALAPAGRQTLWDIGSGSGAVAIEWLRADPGGRAVAFEQDQTRSARIVANARRHGVSSRIGLRGAAPAAFSDSATETDTPDAVFVGGGLDAALLAAAWAALRPGGRLVANAVTIESQSLLADWHRTHAGTLRRVAVDTAAPLGRYLAWRPALPIVTWAGTKPSDTESGSIPSGAS
ncbi:precorrin-6y C5,15-methyltransferase (decarboxylating) subunit CbiE [Gordonia sp. DT30]|uniref:precorrin-6y C5,15-methyltransferase (decarboxylating) subunit CbiE n=1 Tax=Gordonia sp. DT30 TaxID=3416546 RepID=UPI003CF3565F